MFKNRYLILCVAVTGVMLIQNWHLIPNPMIQPLSIEPFSIEKIAKYSDHNLELYLTKNSTMKAEEVTAITRELSVRRNPRMQASARTVICDKSLLNVSKSLNTCQDRLKAKEKNDTLRKIIQAINFAFVVVLGGSMHWLTLLKEKFPEQASKFDRKISWLTYGMAVFAAAITFFV